MKAAHTLRGKLTFLPLLFAVLFVLCGASGCSGAPEADDEQPTERSTTEVYPGAESWQEHALAMPAEAPVVFWARPGRLLDTLGDLRHWLFDRPDMFGERGEQLVGQLQREWEMLTGFLGMDPLSADSIEELGFDPAREIYVGIYPVDGRQTEAFVGAVETSLREGLELGEEEELDEALAELTLFGGMGLPAEFREELQQSLDVPEGIYRRADKAAADKELFGGARAVVPLADGEAFLDNLQRLFDAGQYVRFVPDDQAGRAGYQSDQRPDQDTFFYYDTDGQGPVVMTRLEDDLALIDILAGVPAEIDLDKKKLADGNQEAFEKLEAYVEGLEVGRPAAPRPEDDPMVGVAADQAGAATLARVRGYHTAFQEARMAGVRQRDSVFLQNVHQAQLSAENWAMADGELSGVSYGLFDGADREWLVRLGISLYGRERGAPLETSPARRHLRVDERGVGFSLDLAPANDEAWQEWVGLSDPDELLGYFAAATFDPSLFALSLPRNAVLLLANVNKLFRNRLPDSMASVVEGSEIVERIEFASAGVDMRRLRKKPRFVAMMTLDSEASEEQVAQLAGALSKAIDERLQREEDRIEEVVSEEDAEDEEAEVEPLPVGELVEFERLEGDAPVFAFVEQGDDAPYLFVSYGLEREESLQELERLEGVDEASSRRETAFARVEPVALLSLAQMLDEDVFGPIDVNVLAQRLGALVFSVEPRAVDGVQRIEYDFELRDPPALE